MKAANFCLLQSTCGQQDLLRWTTNSMSSIGTLDSEAPSPRGPYGISLSQLDLFVDLSVTISNIALLEDLRRLTKELELRQLLVFSRSLITDPERYEIFREVSGKRRPYLCCIIWLVHAPPHSLPAEYKEVEMELYKLVRDYEYVLVLILDFTKCRTVVADLMRALDVDELPALVISAEPVDLRSPRRENVVVVKKKALDRLIDQKRIFDFIRNVPVWAELGVLKRRAELEVRVKSLLRELWDEIRPFVSISIP